MVLKLRDLVSLNDYGVDKTGVTNATTKAQAWLDDIKATGATAKDEP